MNAFAVSRSLCRASRRVTVLAALCALAVARPGAALLTEAPIFLGRGSAPAIATTSRGDLTVVWSTPEEIRGQRRLVDGTVHELAIRTGGDHDEIAVASADDGRFAVVWTGSDGQGTGVFVAAFTPRATLARPIALVAPRTRGQQREPRVGMDARSGAFLVAWEDSPPLSFPPELDTVWVRAYGASGAPRGAAIEVTGGFLVDPLEIVALDDGSFAVTVYRLDRRCPCNVTASLVAANGSLAGPRIDLPEFLPANLESTATGFSVFQPPDAAGGTGAVERQYDLSGTLRDTVEHPASDCGGVFHLGARGADDRERLFCSVEEASLPHASWRFGVAGEPLSSVVIRDCFASPDRCDVELRPFVQQSSDGPGSATAFQLAWETIDGVWVHSFASPPGGYVGFATVDLRLRAGETITVPVRRSAPASSAVDVAWSTRTRSGGAAAGEDFVAASGTLSWAAGETGVQTIELVTRRDGDAHDQERFDVELMVPTGGAVLGFPARLGLTLEDQPACVADARTACLLDGRFAARASVHGAATAVSDTSAVWAGNPGVPELALKILDYGDRFKLFVGQLTDLPYQLAVTDVYTAETRVFDDPPNHCGALLQDLGRSRPLARAPGAAKEACAPGVLCLWDGSVEVSVEWRNQYNGRSGAGVPAPYSRSAGLFSFAELEDLELVVKLLPFGDHMLLGIGSLSDLEFTVRVRDVARGIEKSYVNPAGRYCGVLDAATF